MATMTKCRYAKRYKGTRKPACNCDYCQLVWEREQMRRDMQEEMKAIKANLLHACDPLFDEYL